MQETMIACARDGNLHYVKGWLKHNTVDINAMNQSGETALMSACKNGYDHVVAYLLDKGANIESKKPFTIITPLVLACESGRYSTTKLLLDRGASVVSLHSLFLLHSVVETGNDQLLKLLLEHGADANGCNPSYGTLLHRACGYGRTKCVVVLLQHGADTNIALHGQTPLDVAQEYGYEAIIDLLLAHTKKWACHSQRKRNLLDFSLSEGAGGIQPTTTRKIDFSFCEVGIMPTRKQQDSISVNNVVPQQLKQKVQEEDEECTLKSLEKKFSSKIEAMERKFEKQLSELHRKNERKEKKLIKSLKQESQKEFAKLEKEMKDISSVNEKLTSQLQEAEERIDQSNEDMRNLEEELSKEHEAYEILTCTLAESYENVSNLEEKLLLTEEVSALNEEIGTTTFHPQDMEEKIDQEQWPNEKEVLDIENKKEMMIEGARKAILSEVIKCKDIISTEYTNTYVSKHDNEVSGVDVGNIKEQLITTSDSSSIASAFLNEKFFLHLKCAGEQIKNEKKKKQEMLRKTISTMRLEVSRSNEKMQQLETELSRMRHQEEEEKERRKALLGALYDHLELFVESGTLEKKMAARLERLEC